MKIKREFVNKIIGMYRTRSMSMDYPDEKDWDIESIEEINKEIKENANEIVKMLKDDNFLIILRQLIEEDNGRFQVAFAEPYDEDIINIIIFDLYTKKVISKKEINELKSYYSDKNISIA